ncbi:hypothetical protein [Nonomuraea sp. NPDC002799]
MITFSSIVEGLAVAAQAVQVEDLLGRGIIVDLRHLVPGQFEAVREQVE